jgi:hypothetical protein
MNAAIDALNTDHPLRVPVADASGSIVKTRFLIFLQTFRDDVDEGGTTQQKILVDYMSQISGMMQNNKSTVYVNFAHVIQVITYMYVCTASLYSI